MHLGLLVCCCCCCLCCSQQPSNSFKPERTIQLQVSVLGTFVTNNPQRAIPPLQKQNKVVRGTKCASKVTRNRCPKPHTLPQAAVPFMSLTNQPQATRVQQQTLRHLLQLLVQPAGHHLPACCSRHCLDQLSTLTPLVCLCWGGCWRLGSTQNGTL